MAKEIALRLTAPDERRLARRQSVNPEAHIEYLKGLHVGAETSPQAIEMSMRHFLRALDLDPSYAPAWAGVARCHNVRANRGIAPPREATTRPSRLQSAHSNWTSRLPRHTPSWAKVSCTAASTPRAGGRWNGRPN